MKYFLHYSNSFSDDKITLLHIEFGFEAVGLFYVILEKLAAQEKPVLEIVLKKQLRIGKKLQKQLDFMYKIDILSIENGEVFSENILKNTENYQENKEKNRKRISEWRKNKELKKNVTSNEHVRNSPKESKVNKSKVNKSINNKPKGFDFSFINNNFNLNGNSEKFISIFKEYVDYRKEIKKAYKSQKSLEVGFKQLLDNSDSSIQEAENIVNKTIANGWTGIFKQDNKTKNGKTNRIQNDQDDFANGSGW